VARCLTFGVIVVLLAACSTTSSAVGTAASKHVRTPTETESPHASYTRRMCDRLEVAVQAKDLGEATGIARRMAASGYATSPDDATVIDPKIWVDAWALLDAYRHDDAGRYSFALASMQDHCRRVR